MGFFSFYFFFHFFFFKRIDLLGSGTDYLTNVLSIPNSYEGYSTNA